MSTNLLLFIAAACLSAALASCGSGSGAIPGSEGGAPDQEPPAEDLNAARSHAAARMEIATAAPSLTTINAARAALDAYVKVAEAALRSARRSNQQAAAQSALRAARSERDVNQRRLDGLQESLGESPSPGESAGPSGSTGSLAQRLANLRSRSLTSLERGHTYRTYSGQATSTEAAYRCSESSGTCDIAGIQQSGNRYLNAAFFPSSAIPFTLASINGVDNFFDHQTYNDDLLYGESNQDWKLLTLGQYSSARMHILVDDYAGTSRDRAMSYGVALGERHSGRPGGASGSATWRGQMVGAALDNGSALAGEAALTYSFSASTVDVQMSNIRAIGDVAPYTGSKSFSWSGLDVNSDGSFHISGYNNDRSGLTYSSALHPTLGYIDGDFYGPNAEEAAGIFTRGNVNGAWLAKSRGRRISADDGQTPSNGGQASPGSGQVSQGGSGSGGNAGSLVQSRLRDLVSLPPTHLEVGYTYRFTRIYPSYPCSESGGGCNIDGVHESASSALNSAFFPAVNTVATFASSINGVETFSSSTSNVSWKLLALGQHSVARLDISRTLSGRSLSDLWHYGIALGARHDGRPSGPSGSATWRGRMVGVARDNGSLLAGESALTYSFSDNMVDVTISNIRAIDEIMPYAGGTSFTWNDLSVNSNGSFFIPGYNNDRSGVTSSSELLHSTLGYIDGDFYGPNAEETAGIFTRDNVNGAWLAKK